MPAERKQSTRGENEAQSEDPKPSATNTTQAEEQKGKQESSSSTMINQNQQAGNQAPPPNELPPKMKLIVRSQYWGRILKGRTCQNVFTNMNVKAPRVISSQAVLYNTEGFWGCCPNHGKRVLELQEFHFSDVHDNCDWDLFLVGTWLSPSQSVHDFFLLPHDQTTVDIDRNVQVNGWSYVGTCNANDVVAGMDGMLRNLLEQNNCYGHRFHHAHIDIMMDQAFDRETPRSRKLKNEQQRSERNNSTHSSSNGSDVTTDGTASTEQNLTEQESPPSATRKARDPSNSFGMKAVGAPPIPRVITKESATVVGGSYPVSTPNMSSPVTAFRDAGWKGVDTYWNHNLPTISNRNAKKNGNEEVQWHPGKDMSFPGGVASNLHQYWQHKVPYTAAPVPHSTYLLPEMQMHPHAMMAPTGMQMHYIQHHPMATHAGMTHYAGQLQVPPHQQQHHYNHNVSVPYLPSDSCTEGSIPATNGYHYEYADHYGEQQPYFEHDYPQSGGDGSPGTNVLGSPSLLHPSKVMETTRVVYGEPSQNNDPSSPSVLEPTANESLSSDSTTVVANRSAGVPAAL